MRNIDGFSLKNVASLYAHVDYVGKRNNSMKIASLKGDTQEEKSKILNFYGYNPSPEEKKEDVKKDQKEIKGCKDHLSQELQALSPKRMDEIIENLKLMTKVLELEKQKRNAIENSNDAW